MPRSRRDLIDLVLGKPEDFPDEFKAWIPRFLADNVLFSVQRFQVPDASGESWHLVSATGEPAFENGWANFGGLYRTAGFYRDFLGEVHIRGLVKSGTINTNIFSLPAGYRPDATVRVGIDSNSAHGVLEIDSSGSVKCVVGNNAFVQLDNVHYRAFS